MTQKTTSKDLEHHHEKKSYKKALVKLSESQLFFLVSIFFILLFYTLYFARDIIIPFVYALLFHFLLAPTVNYLKKFYIPVQVGAALVILLFLLIIGSLFYGLTKPATEWVNKGPEAIAKVDQKLSRLADFIAAPVKAISSINKEITVFTEKTKMKEENVVSVKNSQIIGTVFSLTSQFLAEVGVTIFLLYFLLISDDFLLRKIINGLPNMQKKKEVVTIVHETENQVWKYLFARTIINIAVAIVVTILMYAFGIPDPILWGIMTGVLEFIPYVGALVSFCVITIVALFSLASVGYAFLVSFLLLMILNIEGNIIAPIVFGHALTTKPIIVFLSLIFWGWIWGLAGIFIAIPLMVTIRIIFETLYEGSFVGELLSD